MANSLDIDWHSSDNKLLLNPRLPVEQRRVIENAWTEFAPDFSAHLGLLTSGSSSGVDAIFGKLVLLSKSALLASARAVNAHLQVTENDIWLKKLPDFHVGGLGIHVRSFLSGARVVDMSADSDKWDAHAFYQKLCDEKITLTALVPSQLFDLLQAGFRAPASLRAVVIGGGAFSLDLFWRASLLGWVALASYGMTETCSQIATADISETQKQMLRTEPEMPQMPQMPKMKILSHAQIRNDQRGHLQIRASSLLTGYIRLQNGKAVFEDPKVADWFLSEDRGEVQGDRLQVWGRDADFLKIGGESVLLPKLEAVFERVRAQSQFADDAVLLAVPDERLGSVIHLLATSVASVDDLVQKYNQEVLPFERIRKTHQCAQIPRSPLGKLLRVQALALIGF